MRAEVTAPDSGASRENGPTVGIDTPGMDDRDALVPVGGRSLVRLRSPCSPAISITPRRSALSSVGSGPRREASWPVHRLGLPRVRHRPGPAAGHSEAERRRHAIAEQTIAELKSAGLAHLPSGRFMANAAWLALAVMEHDLGRAVGQLAGSNLERATAATLRRQLFTMPGRLVHSGRRRHLRLPAFWPWAQAITTALGRIHTIPLRC